MQILLFFCFLKFRRVPKNKIPLLKDQPYIANIIVGIITGTFGIIWFVFRNQSWSWILQNVLAQCLVIEAISLYRLKSYKTVTIFLISFFVYDVFMVFITPLFTNVSFLDLFFL